MGDFNLDQATVNAFDAAYITWLAPAAASLQQQRVTNNPPIDAFTMAGLADQLTLQGIKFHSDIVKWGQDPYGWHISRYNQGFRSYPNNAQQDPHSTDGWEDPNPVNWAPGALPVNPDINATYPDGSKIWVPFIAPAPPAPPPSVIGNPMPGFTINGMQVFAAGVVTGIPVNQQPKFSEGFEYSLPAGIFSIGKVPLPAGKYLYHLLGDPAMDPLERTAVWLYEGATSPVPAASN